MDRNVKIVATLGPSSNSYETIRKLILAGMNVARLNFSHGTHEDHSVIIRMLRAVSTDLGSRLAILQDLQGPKIRVGALPSPIELVKDDLVHLFATGENTSGQTGKNIPVDFIELFSLVHGGDRILLDDGRIEMAVVESDNHLITARVVTEGQLSSHKGINLPGVKVNIKGFTGKDRADLAFGVSQNVDMVAISFVRSPRDVLDVREAIMGMTKSMPGPLLIAKLEKPEALENLESIVEASDGVMVARGDLGVEMPPERVPTAQKRIIHEANNHRKIVITATQMLDSMINNPLPTRAEASDVANAVFDGTDAVMLSGETASGSYPIESVMMMDRIVREAEGNFQDWGHFHRSDQETDDDAVAISRAACELAHDLNVAAIAVFTQTGRSAILMSKMRPGVPIYAFTPVESVLNRMVALWGVKPVLLPLGRTLQDMINNASRYLVESERIAPDRQVVVIGGYPVETVRPPNMALLHTLGEVL